MLGPVSLETDNLRSMSAPGWDTLPIWTYVSALARLGSSATHLIVERGCVPRLHVAGSVAHGPNLRCFPPGLVGLKKSVDSKPQFSLETVGWVAQANPLLGGPALWR